MPHIDIKCYPKHLTDKQFNDFLSNLTILIENHLHAQATDISINYTEILPEDWKSKVYDNDIVPNFDHLAKKPGYTL
jgi:4-oxalocrotonate tautomerase